MNVVESYWRGVHQRMQAEVDSFAGAISHMGEKGRENELALTRVLLNLVPGWASVGTGLVIDSLDHQSPQTDIVVYDESDEPRLMAQTTQVLFPVEVVQGCIEVKTTLNKTEYDTTVAKRTATRALATTRLDDKGEPILPMYALFAYTVDVLPTTVATWIAATPDEDRLDLVCILSPGIVASPGPNGYEAELALVAAHPATDPPTYLAPTGEINDQNLSMHNGRPHPVVPWSGEHYLADPARALVVFMQRLLEQLAVVAGRPAPALGLYLDLAGHSPAKLFP